MDSRINGGPHDTAASAGLEARMRPARRRLATLLLASPWASLVAQPSVQLRLIGVLSLNRAGSDVAQFEAATLRQALRAVGLEEGRQLQIHWRYADTDLARLASQADELVRLDVALILAVTNAALEAAMHATRRIPVVVIAAVLPVELGLVRSLAQPGGNVTGTAWASVEISGKVLQVLRDAVPRAARVAMLVNSAEPGTALYLAENRRAARAMGLTTELVDLAGQASLATALRRVAASRPDALFVGSEGLAGTQLAEIADFARRQRLPAIGVTPQFIQAGGAMYYGPNLASLAGRTASFVARILAGAAPAELPMELPTKYDLIINRKALKAIGVTLPTALLRRADEVIE